jgi:TonB family protein
MAPLTKDATDVANSTADVAAAQPSAPPKQGATSGGTLRADALSLEVPVKVHGSRILEAARGVAPHTEPFEEETGTMIVFPQGGVLRMSTAVTAGQMLVVTNQKTRQDAICRVVKVRTFSNMQGYVEVEFTHQQAGYWGVRFPSEGPAPAPVSVSVPAPEIPPAPVVPPAAPVTIVEPPVKAAPVQPVQDVSWAPAPNTFVAPPTAPVQPQVAPPVVLPPAAPVAPVAVIPQAPVIPSAPSKPEPTFISFGTQEKVELAASSTLVPAAERVAAQTPAVPVQTPPESVLSTFESEAAGIKPPSDAIPSSPIDLPGAPPAAPPPSLTLSDLRGDQRGLVITSPTETQQAAAVDEQAAGVAADVPAVSSRAVFGTFSGGTALGGSNSVPVDAFGARLDSSGEAGAEHAGAPRHNNWMLIAACVALLCATGVAGVFYFRPHSASPAHTGANNSSAPVIPQPLAFQTPAGVPEKSSPDVPAAHNSAMHPVPVVAQAPATAVTVRADGTDEESGPRIVPKPAVSPSVVKSATEDHPVASQHADGDQSVQAPSVEAPTTDDSSNSGALSGIVSSNVSAPEAPEIRPEGPMKVGGSVKEPRLLTRVMPEYPLVAKEANIQGDVVVKTTIDQKGNVVNMQSISGPAMLRGPALAALHRWKYEPSTLNGQPISVEMLVTIKFSTNR